jgi:hypothetical protein
MKNLNASESGCEVEAARPALEIRGYLMLLDRERAAGNIGPNSYLGGIGSN